MGWNSCRRNAGPQKGVGKMEKPGQEQSNLARKWQWELGIVVLPHFPCGSFHSEMEFPGLSHDSKQIFTGSQRSEIIIGTLTCLNTHLTA